MIVRIGTGGKRWADPEGKWCREDVEWGSHGGDFPPPPHRSVCVCWGSLTTLRLSWEALPTAGHLGSPELQHFAVKH